MPANKFTIPQELMWLKHSADLESVSMSSLARKGTAVLRRLTDTTQAVAVKVQGHGAMVTVSQRQYDKMVDLIRQLQQEEAGDEFTQLLSQRFDKLVSDMNQPGAAKAMEAALFSDTTTLNANYGPGATENDD